MKKLISIMLCVLLLLPTIGVHAETDVATINVGNEITVKADGTIDVSVTLPAGTSEASLYIGSQYVGDFSVGGEATVTQPFVLPADYYYKEAQETLTLKYKVNDVPAADVSKPAKLVYRGLEGEAVDLTTYNTRGYVTSDGAFFGNGIHAFEFKVDGIGVGTSNRSLQFCNVTGTGRGPSYDTTVAPRYHTQNYMAFPVIASGKIGDIALNKTAGGDGKAWNTVRVVMDYASPGWDKPIPTTDLSAKAIPRPYKVYLNGTLAKEGTFISNDEASYTYYTASNIGVTDSFASYAAADKSGTSYTDPIGYYNTNGSWPAAGGNGNLRTSNKYNGFTEVRWSSTGNIDTTSFKVYRIDNAVPKATQTSVKYFDSEDPVVYTGAELVAYNMDYISFTFDKAVDNVAGNIKLVDENGLEVSDVLEYTATNDNKTFNAVLNADLSTGTYRLILDKDVTLGGAPLGACLASEAVKISDVAGILSPAADEVINASQFLLKAYIPTDCSNVQFYVNGSEVPAIGNSGDGLYYKDYQITEYGLNTIEILYDDALGNKKLVSRNFTSAPSSFKYNEEESVFPAFASAEGTTFKSSGLNQRVQTTSLQYPSTGAITMDGRVVIEGKLTLPNTTTKHWFDIGANTANKATTGTGWVTHTESDFGLGGNGGAPSTPMFYNGKIASGKVDGVANANATYEAGVPFNFKFVMDFDKGVLEFYKDGVLVANKTSGFNKFSTAYHNIYSKVGFCSNVAGEDIGISNYKIYNEGTAPVIAGVDGATNVGCSYVIPVTATSIGVTFDGTHAAITKEDIKITKADGSVVTFADVVYDSEAKKVTVNGMEGINAGDIIKITVLGTAKVNADYLYIDSTATPEMNGANKVYPIVSGAKPVEAGSNASVYVYVGDANNLFVKPFGDFNGSDVVFKYINGPLASINKMIFTKIADSKLDAIDIQEVTFEANKTDVIKKSTTIGAGSVMLWGADYIPLLGEMVKVTQ